MTSTHEGGWEPRPLWRWFLYWVIAFVILAVFYAAIWLPLIGWALSGIGSGPKNPAIDWTVSRLIGDLVYALFYGVAWILPVLFTSLGIVSSADPEPLNDPTADEEAKPEPGDVSGWLVWGIVLFFPGLILFAGCSYELREYLDACVWGDTCSSYFENWEFGW